MTTTLDIRDGGALLNVNIKGPATIRGIGGANVDGVFMEPGDEGDEIVYIEIRDGSLLKRIDFDGPVRFIVPGTKRERITDVFMATCSTTTELVDAFMPKRDRVEELRLIEAAAKADFKAACAKHPSFTLTWYDLSRNTRLSWMCAAANRLGLEAP